MFTLALIASFAFACGPNDEFCGENAISEAIRSCSENFVYDDVLECCVSEVSYPALLRCANGGVPGPDGTCLCQSHPLSTCAQGFFFDSHQNTCVAIDRVAMIPSCAHRPDLGGKLTEDASGCTYFTESPPRPLCPAGSRLRDGSCVAHNILPEGAVSWTCPDGWSLDTTCNECVLIEDVDCKKQRPICKAPKIKECATQPFEPCIDCVIEEPVRRLCDGAHCKEKVKPEHVCQAARCKMGVKEKEPKTRSFVQPVVCQRVTTLPAKPVCSVGDFVKSKNACAAESLFAPDMVCPPGCSVEMTANGSCLKEMTYLTDFVCPEPYVVSCSSKNKVPKKSKKTAHPSTCECVLQTESPVIPTCTDLAQYSPESGMCEELIPSIPYCAEPDAILVDGLCTRSLHEPVRLEYTVTYVTEKPCQFDECIKEKIPIKKRKVVHKEVKVREGRTHTRCEEVSCVNVNGDVFPPGAL